MDKQTRLDQLLTWFKNNRLFAIAMLVAIGVVGASQFVSSLASLIDTGEHLFSNASHEVAIKSKEDSSAPSIAEQVLKFGGVGAGPGYFETYPAWIEISPQGQLVIGEFGDDTRGRIQLFDLDGRFIVQWFAKEIEPGRPGITEMALDPQGGGVLYLWQLDGAYRYDLAGNSLGKLSEFRTSGANEAKVLASDPSGGIVALWNNTSGGEDSVDLVRYDHGAANPRLIKSDLLKGHLKNTFFSIAVAVDGAKNIYAVYSDDSPIFKFSPDGEFLDRFGESGSGPGQWDSPTAIAIDGAGHIAVAAFNGIHVLNANGHYVGKFERELTCTSAVRSMAFDVKGNLYALCDSAVVKYRLNLS